MDERPPEYDRRYLTGVVLFNRGEWFEAHEAWEDLWADSEGPERRFYQGLIQAAVGLCHFANGNLRGAFKLYHSARGYMDGLDSPFRGLNTQDFWERMGRCFASLLAAPEGIRVEPDEGLFPVIELDPPPSAWPDPGEDSHE
jgi:predicted metal-dependent hydrolase